MKKRVLRRTGGAPNLRPRATSFRCQMKEQGDPICVHRCSSVVPDFLAQFRKKNKVEHTQSRGRMKRSFVTEDGHWGWAMGWVAGYGRTHANRRDDLYHRPGHGSGRACPGSGGAGLRFAVPPRAYAHPDESAVASSD